MIINKEDIYARIRNYKFEENRNDIAFSEKIIDLENAIDNSITTVCEYILKTDERIHLAYSGGVDSSIILAIIIEQNFPVVTHTISSREDHPDMVAASEFVKLNDIGHIKHIIQDESVDNYYMLMKATASHTSNLICCDCIDELMGGYYAHQKDTIHSLNHFMDRLIPDHLEILDKFSNDYGTNIWLPYGKAEVMCAASRFSVQELVDDIQRKKPVYAVAKRKLIPQYILERKKYGLVSALM